MENYIKNNIQGEILIPLETYYKLQEINEINQKLIKEQNNFYQYIIKCEGCSMIYKINYI